jgi:hypothetical protein
MPIQFPCSCGRQLQAAEEHAGRLVKCPACGAETTVPGPEVAVQPREAAEPKASPVRTAEERDDDRPRRRARDRDEDEDDDDRPRRRRSRDRYGDDDDYDEGPREPRKKTGTGTVLIVVLVVAVLLVIPCLIGLLVPAVQKVREAASRAQAENNLKQLVLAIHNYNDTYNHLPPATPEQQGGPASKLSWRVQVLPYVEQGALWQQFHQDEPWDSPHNKALLTPMPLVYSHPLHPEANAQGLTYFRVFVGKSTPFPPGKASTLHDNFPDGLANTILIVESADPVPWTKPDELAYDPLQPLPKLGGHFPKKILAVMADGSVRMIDASTPEPTLRHAINPKEGHLLPPDW